MSKPPIFPETTVSGIAVDPRTFERVIPESRRPDGSVRKQIKIRPGFTPQEDVKSFKTRRQTTIEANALPKGHIIGWVPPSSASASAKTVPGAALTKSAKKNLRRKKKREEIRENWEDDDDEGDSPSTAALGQEMDKPDDSTSRTEGSGRGNPATANGDELAEKLSRLEVM